MGDNVPNTKKTQFCSLGTYEVLINTDFFLTSLFFSLKAFLCMGQIVVEVMCHFIAPTKLPLNVGSICGRQCPRVCTTENCRTILNYERLSFPL